jgi:putative spermidine/putrescine transport system permease protein
MAVLDSETRDAPQARPARTKRSWAWLGVVPFFIFTFAFLLYPSSTIVIKSFQDSITKSFTFQNINTLLHSQYLMQSYWISIKLSLITAIGGGIFGFLLAYAAIRGSLPRFVAATLPGYR